jgi:hypothetical protein
MLYLLAIKIMSSTPCTSMNKKRSNVWYQFTVVENNVAKCNICFVLKCFTGGSTAIY